MTLTSPTSPTMYPVRLAPMGAPPRPAQLSTSVRSWLAPSIPAPAVNVALSSAQEVSGVAVNTALDPTLYCTVQPLLVSSCLVSPRMVYSVPGQSVRGWVSWAISPANAVLKRAMVPLAVETDDKMMLGSKSLLMNQPSVVLSVCMLRVGERTRLPVSAHAASICSCDARVPVRRKRETGAEVASTPKVAAAVILAATLGTALRISETIDATSDAAGAGSLAVRPAIADAIGPLSSPVSPAGRVSLRLTVEVPLRPVGAALLDGQFEIGTVSTIVVVMITSLVM